MRLKPYKNGECKGSWNCPEERGEFSLHLIHPGCDATYRVYRGTVICQYCGRKVPISKRGFMNRHEKMVGRPVGRAWEGKP
jgi:hypothetical protein